MKSKYLDPLRVMNGIGRRAEALRARKVKRKRFAEAKVFLTHTNFPLKVNGQSLAPVLVTEG